MDDKSPEKTKRGFRAFTDSEEDEISEALRLGQRPEALAVEKGVHFNTILNADRRSRTKRKGQFCAGPAPSNSTDIP